MTSRPPFMQFLAVLLLTALPLVTYADELLLVQFVHRHGDRSPVNFLPNSTNKKVWTQGLGQLTATGMQQLHSVGTSLRARYYENMNFLSFNYSVYEFHCRSTDVDRTLMSAQSLQYGLYPPSTGPISMINGNPGLPGRAQPLPIHTIPKSTDTLLRAYSDGVCPKFDSLFIKRRKSTYWKDKVKSSQANREKWSKLAGYSSTIPLKDIYRIHDPINVDVVHGLPLPAGFTMADFNALTALANWEEAAWFGAGELKGMADETHRLIMGAMLNEFEANMRGKLDGSLTYKLMEYSAHDTTLASLLSGLGVYPGHNPPYGSQVLFELWNNTNNEPYIKLWYNKGTDNQFNASNLLTLPGCSQKCPLVKFQSLYEDVYARNITVDCGLVHPAKPQEQPSPVPDIMLGMLGGFLLAVLIVVIVWAVRRRQAAASDATSYGSLETADMRR